MSGDWRGTLWTLLVTFCVVIIRCTETFWSPCICAKVSVRTLMLYVSFWQIQMLARHIITHLYVRDGDSSPVCMKADFNGIWHNAQHQWLQVFLIVNITKYCHNHVSLEDQNLCQHCQFFSCIYRCADKSLARPGRKQTTVTEDFDFHIFYL